MNIRFILIHIWRAKVKSAIIILVAFLFIFAIAMVNLGISRLEARIDYLYDNTFITGEVFTVNPMQAHAMGLQMLNTLMQQSADNLRNNEFLYSYYFEAGYLWFFLILPDENNNFPGDSNPYFWQEFLTETLYEAGEIEFAIDPLMSFSNIDEFLAEFTGGAAAIPGVYTQAREPLNITFGENFSIEDFEYTPNNPIPVILTQESLDRLGLGIGDTVFLGHNWSNHPHIFELEAVVIGSHNDTIVRDRAQRAVLVPHNLFTDHLRSEHTVAGYITFRFVINPIHNRDLAQVENMLGRNVRNVAQNQFLQKGIIINDAVLINAISQINDNLELLRLLYPIILITVFIIAAIIATLISLQNSKNAAILRVLGAKKLKVRATLALEYLMLTTTIVTLAMLIIPISGLLLPASLYIAGSILGTIIAVCFITSKPPLSLLQARE